MGGLNSISPVGLHTGIGTAHAPIRLDLRRMASFEEVETLLVGALRRDRSVIAYGVHGKEVGKRVVAALRASGVQAVYLEGGITGSAELSRPDHGLVMNDALHPFCRSCQDETHNWTPGVRA